MAQLKIWTCIHNTETHNRQVYRQTDRRKGGTLRDRRRKGDRETDRREGGRQRQKFKGGEILRRRQVTHIITTVYGFYTPDVDQIHPSIRGVCVCVCKRLEANQDVKG